MADITIWHNPRCSKSRNALELLNEKGIEPKIYKYLNENPTFKEIETLLSMLKIAPGDLMRTKEDIYKELNLKAEQDEKKLIEAMVSYPKLIERPIVIKGDSAVIGRPIENIIELVKE